MNKLATAILGMTIFLAPLAALGGAHTENFATTAFQDLAATTADWNTGSGELAMFPFTYDLLASYSTPGTTVAIAVDGQHAYVADHSAGLQIFDISSPASPVLLGNYNTPGFALDVVIEGKMAFIADYTAGMQIVDISDPTNPTLVGTYNTTDTARGIAVSGDRACIADGAGGLQIIDVSTLGAPVLLGTYDTFGVSYDVVLSGQRAYVADGAGGFLIIDIRTPASPFLVGGYNTTGTAYRVAVSGERAYVADGANGLQVIDISNPSHPPVVGSFSTLGTARDISISGDRAYLADDTDGLLMLDISNPSLPTLLNTFNTGGSAHGITTSGNRAYIADSVTGLQIVGISHTVGPATLGSYATSGQTEDIATDGDLAYISTSFSGLQTVDISDPANPFLVGNYSLAGELGGLAISGDYAYLAQAYGGLAIFDISNPAIPTLASVLNTTYKADEVVVYGNRAYVADNSLLTGNIVVVDVSDPVNPVELGVLAIGAPIRNMVVSGNYLYSIHRATSGAFIIDLSNPVLPTPVSAISPPHPGTGVSFKAIDVSGDRLYIADSNSMIHIVDISDATSPSTIGTYAVDVNNVTDIAVSGDHAYVAAHIYSGPGDIRVIDISDPANPRPVGSYQSSLRAEALVISGQQAYAADNAGGLQVLQVAQETLDSSRNVGQSLQLNTINPYPVYAARLSATDADSVGWELSADGGVNFQAATPGVWTAFATPGSDIRWRSTLVWDSPGANSSVSNVTVDWRNPFAMITAVSDLPNDQGKQVRVSWNRSGHDLPGDPTPILEYAVYRQIDLSLPKKMAPFRNKALASSSAIVRQHAALMKAAGWDFLATVPAQTSDAYAAILPTVVDSTVNNGPYNTVFYVSALTATPGVFYNSPPDSGYSRDNLSPGLPLGVVASYAPGGGMAIDWVDATEPDFMYYNIYRSEAAGFTPSPANRVRQTVVSSWTDLVPGSSQYYYKITAIDFSGNESPASAPGVVSGITGPTVPRQTTLRSAVPNPFNPLTTISFELAAGGPVQLKVYDAAGRLVNTLVDEIRAAGHYEVVWNGQDAAGHMSAAGVYLYRLDAGSYAKTRRMTLVK